MSDIRKNIKEHNLQDAVEFHDNFETEGLREFLDKVSMVSVPVRNGEAFGIYLLECMVSGVPVVQPKLGAFPEIIELSGGGVVFEPDTPEELAKSLSGLLSNKEELDRLSFAGKKGVEKHFHISVQAERMISVYEKAIEEVNVMITAEKTT